jgi:acyl dehydratase
MIATPERAPDVVVSRTTRAEAALIYRLSGDMNPLHADPDVASRAGFPRPILHGLATYGMACHALIEAFCSHEAARLRSLEVRFSSPVFPGDAIEFQYWREGGEIALRALVPERKVVVLTHGRAVCDGTVA